MLPEPEVERLVRENTGLIGEVLRKTVPRFSMLPGGHTREDLESLGRRGLVQAAHNYDPSRGVRFSTFAFQCIKNEIIGELSKAINNEVHWISLDTPVGEEEDTLLGDLQADEDSDTETLVLDNVDSETLRAAIALLTPPMGEIIEDVYFNQMSVVDVARKMRRSPQHVQTLHGKALKILRRRLQDFR